MNKKIKNLIVFIIVIVLLGLSGYFYFQLRNVKNNPNIGIKEEVKSLVDRVSRLYLLPSDEEPTIATVSDPEILKDQSFFNLAKKDDKVLIFTKAGKAVLYRPSIDKIIEVAPIKNGPDKQDVIPSKEKKN